MTSLQESKLSMYQSVQLLCANNPTITSTNAAFSEGLNELNLKIIDILNCVSTDIKIPVELQTSKVQLNIIFVQ